MRLRKGDTSLPVELTDAEPGHYVATALTVPSPGDWTLRLIVRTSDIDEQTIDVGREDPMRLAAGRAALLLALAARARSRTSRSCPESSRPGETGEFTFRVAERARRTRRRSSSRCSSRPACRSRPSRAEGWTITRIAGGIQLGGRRGRPRSAPGRTEDFKVRLGPLPGPAAARLQGAAVLRRRAGRALDPGPGGGRRAARGGARPRRRCRRRRDRSTSRAAPWLLIVVGARRVLRRRWRRRLRV